MIFKKEWRGYLFLKIIWLHVNKTLDWAWVIWAWCGINYSKKEKCKGCCQSVTWCLNSSCHNHRVEWFMKRKFESVWVKAREKLHSQTQDKKREMRWNSRLCLLPLLVERTEAFRANSLTGRDLTRRTNGTPTRGRLTGTTRGTGDTRPRYSNNLRTNTEITQK